MSWQPDYATTAQVNAYLRLDDDVDNDEIATAITDASRSIDRACGRQFGNVDSAETRTYRATWSRSRNRWIIRVDDFASTTGLTVTIGGTEVTDWTAEPLNAPAKGRVFEQLVLGHHAEAYPTHHDDHLVDVDTDQWGWTTVPVAVLQACKIQAGRFNKRRDALFGVAGSPADGSEVRLLASLDPDVQVSLTNYRRRWVAVRSSMDVTL